MELFRSLALLAEAPGGPLERVSEVLELGVPPTAVEFTDLFEFQLYPYASVYLGGEGMMGGEARDRIAGFWRALGETPPSEPDHLTVMLAAYAELAERQVDADNEETRSRWRHARAAFLWEHLLSWLPVYLEKVREVGSEFYSKWSELVSTALFDEMATLSLPELLPLHLREAPPLGELNGAGGDEFLEAITAPARTGVILVRADLERCARRLGLGLRKGERRYVLKSLLGQDPRKTLEWLADEANRWADRHRDRKASLAQISSFWQQRAETTSVFLRESAASLSSGA
jgi:TorA maturation chaperone TorD